MTSITGWNRIEPVARDQGFREGLQAPIHDPAWTIARQWQIGEFQGEDAASAVLARIAIRSQDVTHYRPGGPRSSAATVAYDGTLPLESLVEAETPTDFGAIGWLDRSEAGLMFLRLLAAHPALAEQRAMWIAAQGFAPLDPADLVALPDNLRAEYEELRQTSPDGARLALFLTELLDGSQSPPPAFSGDPQAMRDVARRWLTQWRSVFVATADQTSAWQDNRMEYAFSLSVAADADGIGAALEAREYHGGDIDWHDFDIRRSAGFGAGPAPRETTIARIPMPVDFAGMPAPRWWEFEDARFALPQVEAAPDDLIKMVLVDFALVYGGDWLVVPLELATGAIHRIWQLTVTDTFGQETEITAPATDSDPLRAWTMHNLADSEASLGSRPTADDQVLFLPRISPGILNGEPRETVEFGRDEVANFVLARETIIASPLGSREDREQAYRMTERPRPPAPTDGPAALAQFHLAEPVPDYWIPFVAQAGADKQSIRLRRGAFLDPDTGQRARARGRILVPERKLLIEEEEISQIGMTISRLSRIARGSTGETVLWHGRKRKPGKGDQSNDIRFDKLTGGSSDDP